MIVGRQIEELGLERLPEALGGRVDLEGVRTDHVVLDERELARRDASAREVLEELELERHARRAVGGGGKGPHRERMALSFDRQASARAVGPPALAPDLAHHPRGERAAEDGRGRDERPVVRVARVCAEAADEDLRLRTLRLVDEEQASPLGRRGLGERIVDARPLGHRADEQRAERLRLLLRDRSGEAEHDVRLHEALGVRREHVLARELVHARGTSRGGARIRVTLEQRAPKGEAGEAAIVVAGVDQLGDRLALEAVELALVERRGAEHPGDELAEGLEVPADHLPVEADRRRPDVESDLAAEAIHGALDLGRRHALAAAAHHACGQSGEPVLALGVGERAAPQRERDRDERDDRGALDEAYGPAGKVEARAGRV